MTVTTVVGGSWISAESPAHLSSNLFCSACVLILRSRLQILVLLAFFEEGTSITHASVEFSAIRILSLKTLLAKSHTLRAHLSWCKVFVSCSFCDQSAHGLRSRGSHFWKKKTLDGPFRSRIFERGAICFWCMWRCDSIQISQVSAEQTFPDGNLETRSRMV